VSRRDTDYGVLLVWVAVAVFTVALILIVSHADKPPARTATEQAAIEWGEEHLNGSMEALCDGSACIVWGVSYVRGGAVAATPAIPLDCSAKPCVMVKP
jgi:hypothetical protein